MGILGGVDAASWYRLGSVLGFCLLLLLVSRVQPWRWLGPWLRGRRG